MTKEQLFEAIGALDEATLDENVGAAPKKQHFGWLAAAAACLAVCIGAAFLPKLLQEEALLQPNSALDATIPTETQSTEATEQYAGFVSGINYYPLSEGDDADAVCEQWMSSVLGGAAYFTFHATDAAQGVYQVVDPLSSANPETGTFTQEQTEIIAASYDGTQSHRFTILNDYAMELTESTSWSQFEGRIFTSRWSKQEPFAALTPEDADSITGLICNGWEISLDDAQMEEFRGYLQEIVYYQELRMSEEFYDGGDSVDFTMTTSNGTANHYAIANGRFYIDGTKFLLEQSSAEKLFDFLRPLAEQARLKWEEDSKQLSYQMNTTYCLLDGDYSADMPYNDFSAATGASMELTLSQANYRIDFTSGEESERGIYNIVDGFLICTRGEDVHKFEILDNYSIRLVETTHEGMGCANFLDRNFTCRLWPEQYFETAISDELLQSVRCSVMKDGKRQNLTLTKAQTAEFLRYVKEIVVYKDSLAPVSADIVDTSEMQYFSIVQEGDPEGIACYLGKYISLDNEWYIYETSTGKQLMDFCESLIEEEPMDTASILQNPDVFTKATASHWVSAKSAELTEEQFAELKTLLRNIVLLEEDTSGELLFGDSLSYTLIKENGVTVSIHPGGNRITIDGTRYFTEPAPCEALSQFGHNVLETRFAEK